MKKLKKKVKIAKATKTPKVKAEHPAFTAWKDGTTIAELVTEHKMTRSQMRRLLTDAAGGKAKFRELRAQGAGGTAVAFGGKRGGRSKTAEGTFKHDDSKVPHIASSSITMLTSPKLMKHMRQERDRLKAELENPRLLPAVRVAYRADLKNARQVIARGKEALAAPGWKSETFWTPTGTALRAISPDGERYVPASAAESAHLVITLGDPSLPPTRMKRESEARLARQLKQETEQLERGKAALEKEQETKRAKRKARKEKRLKAGRVKIKKVKMESPTTHAGHAKRKGGK